MDKLATLLLNGEEKQLNVVSLVGSEGVGKTTLAKRLYHKTGGQFQCRAFLRVSPEPDMRRILTSMFTRIQSPGFSQGVSDPACRLDAQDLITNIAKHLQDKRYIIIIDDLWSTSVWDIIRRAFPNDGCHSRIITTTQIEDVASACCSYQSEHIFEMEPLKDYQLRKLFFSMVFGSEDEVDCPKDFVIVSDGIIRKCGGLPLLTVNVASLLPMPSEQNLQQWMDIRDSLPPTMRRYPTSEGMEKVINLIYNNLSPKLKTCLLYLIMYPEGYMANKDDFLKQWVTEGFIGEGQNKEEIARAYFDELVNTGMIQASDINYHGVLSCTLHHTVHGLLVNKSIEENFIIIVDNFQSAICLPDKVRRLSVQFGGARSAHVPTGIMVSEVRSLAFFGLRGCSDFIQEYTLLRVLTLHVWADQEKETCDLSGILKLLLQLRYLKIECNTTVKLPDKIQGLQYLETLEVDPTVVAIPSDIAGLSRLSSLKIAVSVLSSEDIRNLRALPALSALSLHVWTTPAEMIVFKKGEFLALKYFKLRCPVPWLKFEAGSMPDLRNLSLCFNAHEADQHGTATISIEHLPGLKEITAHIWGADNFRTAIISNPRIDVQLVDCIFHGDTSTSMGTKAKEHMSKDEGKGEDAKEEAADSRLLGFSSRVPMPDRWDMEGRPSKQEIKDTMESNLQDTSQLTNKFTLDFLQHITNNFSVDRILGRGGGGVVYKGVLENGEEIALKKLNHIGLDDKEFTNEFNNIIRAHHQNIVQSVGYCYHEERRCVEYNGQYVFLLEVEGILSFEYLHGGDLERHLSEEQTCGLDWQTCYKIIKGVCVGLNYLHSGNIYHLDLKPANILLNSNMMPKIGDFGISRIFPSTKTITTATTTLTGTMGYMPPEYIDKQEI